jgi:hypothetical protein
MNYKINRINEITTMEHPQKNTKLCLSIPFSWPQIAFETTAYVFIPTPSKEGLQWTSVE